MTFHSDVLELFHIFSRNPSIELLWIAFVLDQVEFLSPLCFLIYNIFNLEVRVHGFDHPLQLPGVKCAVSLYIEGLLFNLLNQRSHVHFQISWSLMNIKSSVLNKIISCSMYWRICVYMLSSILNKYIYITRNVIDPLDEGVGKSVISVYMLSSLLNK